MRPTVLIVNGYPLAGKDTFCAFAKDMFCCIEHSTVSTIKRIAMNEFGWSGDKTPEARHMLSDLKDFYTKWFNGPFNEIVRIINFQIKYNKMDELPPTEFIFLHIREPQEITKVQEWCRRNGIECYTVFINRDIKGDTNKISNHADKNVEKIMYDVYIGNNNSLEMFKINTLHFLSTVKDGSFKKMVNLIH